MCGVEAPLAGLLGPRGRQGRGETVAVVDCGAELATLKHTASSPLYRRPHNGLPLDSPLCSPFPAHFGSSPSSASSALSV